MKKILLFIASITLSIGMYAQRPTATIEQVNDFVEKATLYVVLYENPLTTYNSEIRKAVEKNWTLTPFKTVYMADLESKLSDPNNAFLIPVNMQFGEDKDSVTYTFLSLLIGGQYETINDLPEICTFPLCYEVADEEEMTYKLPAIISFFNKQVQNIQKDPKLLKDKKFATYTNLKSNISDKTIYLITNEQNQSLDEPSEIKALNPIANVVFVDDYMTMEKIIRRKEANALFFHIVGAYDEDLIKDGEMIPSRCYKILMDVDGNLYYFAFHKMMGDASQNGLTAKDWKTLATYTK